MTLPMGISPGPALSVGSARLPVRSAYLSWGATAAEFGTFMSFDAVLSEEHARTSQVTDHPVEEGTNIVDNVRPLPDRLTLEVFVSDTPIASPLSVLSPATLDIPMPAQGGALAGIAGGLSSPLNALISPRPGPTYGVNVQQFSDYTDFVGIAFTQLDTLRTTATLISVVTPKAQYTNMILESIRMHRDPRTGTSANFTLEFREIVTVTSQIVSAPLPSIPPATPPVNTGKQQTAPATGPMQSVGVTQGLASGVLTGPASS